MDKQHINGSGDILITFRVPAEVRARTVAVVGEFNDWSEDAHPMRRDNDALCAVIPLTPGRSYRGNSTSVDVLVRRGVDPMPATSTRFAK